MDSAVTAKLAKANFLKKRQDLFTYENAASILKQQNQNDKEINALIKA